MNIEIEQLKEKLKKLLPGKKVGYEPHQVTRCWFTIILASVVIGLVLCGVGIFQFFVTSDMKVAVVETGDMPLQTFSKQRLLATVERYQSQVAQFGTMRNTAPLTPFTGTETTETEESVMDAEATSTDDVLEDEEVLEEA